MILIPSTDKKFVQTNRSNVLGNLWSTFNIDLQDNLGLVQVGKRMKIVTKTGDTNAANLGVATAFTAFTSKIVCLAGSRVFISNGLTPQMTFVEDSSTGARTDWSVDTDDLCNFNSTLVGLNMAQGKLYSLDTTSGGTWTTRSTIAGGSANGQLAYFQKFNRLYATNGANIHSVDTSWNVSSTGNTYDLQLTGNDNGNIVCITPGSDRIWFGTRRLTVGGTSDNSNIKQSCSMYEWDGISNQVTKEYKIPAQGIMAITMRRDIPIILDTEGVLREFNGQGFIEIGRLPLKNNQSLFTVAFPGWTQNFIHPKGLVVTKNDTVLALINSSTLSNYGTISNSYENLPSGIWEFDTKGSAWHRNSLSVMPMSSTSVTDYGQNNISLIGSLAYIKDTSTSAYGMTSLYAGAEYYTNATTTKDAIFMEAPSPVDTSNYPEGQKYGYFVTPFYQANMLGGRETAVSQVWKKVFLNYRQLVDSGDEIVVKYRTVEADPTYVTITWTSTTTFTTTTDLSSYVGYEVEIIRGIGGGKCSHIISAPFVAGTCTVTVDKAYTGASNTTAVARIQNWTLLGTVNDQTSEYNQFPIARTSSRIQVKVCMQFKNNDEFHQLAIINSPYLPLE